MSPEARRPMIVTFKKKDERKEQKLDKVDILRQHVKGRQDFCDVLAMQDMGAVPSTFEAAPVGLDINLYDLPIVAGSFTDREIKGMQGVITSYSIHYTKLYENYIKATEFFLSDPLSMSFIRLKGEYTV